MPILTLSKKGLLAAAGRQLGDDDLQERLSMLGTGFEGMTGDEVSVEIFPNRPDLLSRQGFERAFAAFLGTKPGLRRYDVRRSGEKVIIDKSVERCRPYTSCAIVKNLKIDEEKLKEIIQIQEKLHITFCRNRKRAAIGVYPVEHISFPIHFKGLKPGEIRFRPLESEREMTAKEVLEQHPKGREYAHLLKGLDRYACFLDAKNNVMSLTPLINSHLTGKITEKTTNLFVECSGFDQRILDECLAMIVTAFAEMGGELYSLELEYPDRSITTPDLAPKKMKVDRNYINRLLGLSLKEPELKKLLEKMGYGYEEGHALVPTYRTDILHQADFAEDVAIAYGYEKIPEVIPNVATVGAESGFEQLCTKVRQLLVGHGLLEAKNYGLVNREAQTRRMRWDSEVVTLRSAVSSEYDSLRAWVLPSLMETLQRNRRHEYPQLLFEIGRVFAKEKVAEQWKGREEEERTGVREKVRLAAVLCGEEADYTRIRQLLDDLLAKLGVEAKYRETEHPSFIQGRVARVSAGEEGIAYIGELHPQVLESFGLTMPVAAFELDLSAVFEKLRGK
jgi:phenylalanyl-tRNA synthetase beta chain